MINFNAIGSMFPKLDMDAFKKGLEIFKISDRDEVIALLAQISHESGDFRYLSENLNYSAAGLSKTWPSRFLDKAINEPNSKAVSIARNPQKIANCVYCNRMGNGDETSGDGWKYRGKGYIQLTGKTQYITIGNVLYQYGLCEHPTDLVNNPDMLLKPDYALYSALAYWKNQNCGSIYHDFKSLTRRINGGLVGLQDRIDRRDKISKIA